MASVATLKTLGTVTLTTAGTAQKLFATAPFPKVSKLILITPSTNAGVIFVGDENVNASTLRGIRMPASTEKELSGGQAAGGGSLLLDVTNLWIDASANSQAVIVLYYEVQ